MGPQEAKIRIVDREDLGPVLARADHELNVIEVNKAAFYKLPPMMQEFVLCHEVCHLRHNEWDEVETNRLASRLFMERSANEADRAERRKFLSYLDGTDGDYSNWWQAVLAALPAAFNLGSSIYGAIKQSNSGWYGWDTTTQKANLDVMLTQAFEQSRKTSKQSAAQIFWQQLQQYDFKDDSLAEFLARSDNSWVRSRVAAFEKKYGFRFDAVTPVDLTAFPLAIVAIGALVGFVVYKIIKKRKK